MELPLMRLAHNCQGLGQGEGQACEVGVSCGICSAAVPR